MGISFSQQTVRSSYISLHALIGRWKGEESFDGFALQGWFSAKDHCLIWGRLARMPFLDLRKRLHVNVWLFLHHFRQVGNRCYHRSLVATRTNDRWTERVFYDICFPFFFLRYRKGQDEICIASRWLPSCDYIIPSVGDLVRISDM